MNKKVVLEGLRDGFPIGLGYFAVAFSLGIVAQKAGVSPVQGFFASLFNMASAGEYALFTSIEVGVTYIEIAIITLVVNARYLLMSCVLSQRFDPNTKMIHRFLLGFGITDELFGITIAREGKINPVYNYAAFVVAALLWSSGTSCGIVAGNFMPQNVVSALSVALYGMFLAIIVPPAKKDKVIAIAVAASFVTSYCFTVLPYVKTLSSGNRTIIITVVISAILALVKPVKENNDSNEIAAEEKSALEEE